MKKINFEYFDHLKGEFEAEGLSRKDVAAESLAKLRGALIPEQELVGYGNKSIKISPYLEIFYGNFCELGRIRYYGHFFSCF